MLDPIAPAADSQNPMRRNLSVHIKVSKHEHKDLMNAALSTGESLSGMVRRLAVTASRRGSATL